MRGRFPVIVAAGGVALLAALYAAGGYWLAPRYVRGALANAAARNGVELDIERVRTDPFALSIALEGVQASAAGGGKLGGAQRISADLAWSSLWEPGWRVQKVSIERPEASVDVGPEGVGNWRFKKAAGPPESANEPPPVVVENLEVHGGTLQVAEEHAGHPLALQLESLEIEASGLANREGGAGEYRVAGRLASGGALSAHGRFALGPWLSRGSVKADGVALEAFAQALWPAPHPPSLQLSGNADYTLDSDGVVLQNVSATAADPGSGARLEASGDLRFSPFSAEVALDASRIGAQYVRPWLPEGFKPKLAAGLLSLKGKLRVAGGAVQYAGAAAVSGLRLEEADSGKLLLACGELSTESGSLRTSPFALDLGEVLAQAPEARLIIEPGGSVNLAEAFAHKKDEGAPPPEVSVGRLLIRQGVLHFADRTLETPFEATSTGLEGTVSGLGTGKREPATLALAGKVDKSGSARIDGKLDLAHPSELADVSADLRDIDLARLTPYVAKFAGYRVRSGRASAKLRYQVHDGQLVASNDLLLHNLRLGEKVERKGAKSLPLDLLVALLADREGRISLDIPVTGNLADPDIDFGALVGRAIGAVVGKVVSAPFRALAGLFGGAGEASGEVSGEELGKVRFAPGSADVLPPEEERIARVARALGERPALEVTVQGGYEREYDAAALRVRAVEREILEHAGRPPGGQPDFSDPKILRGAEALYSGRIGDPAALHRRATDPRVYGRALVEMLARARKLEPESLEALGRRRAQAVADALAKRGVPQARVAIAAREGLPTELELAAAPR